MRNLKSLRMLVTIGVLIVGLACFGWTTTRGVDATDCDTAFQNYINADYTYESARYSYFYGIPTTCEEECQPKPVGPERDQCISDCRIRRYTELGDAQLGLFSMALDTCIPYQYDQCESARAMANSCLSQYDPSCYSDPEEASAVADQRAACREASKVDYCQ
jgi:hypothetical protein